MAAHLCLPSPCCQSHLGKPTGYKVHQGNDPTHVNAFGDVMSATLCFNTWRTCHSDVMRAITARVREARLEVECEVFSLFRDIIPVEAIGEGGELETVRGRSGFVPDMRLGFPVKPAPRPAEYQPCCGRPPANPALAAPQARAPGPRAAPAKDERNISELKVMGAGSFNYPWCEARSMDRKAPTLPAMYKRKLVNIDRQYYNTMPGLQARFSPVTVSPLQGRVLAHSWPHTGSHIVT